MIIFAFIMVNITDQQLKELSEKLKNYFSNWTALVADGISKEKDWKAWTNNPCIEQNARHIAKGVIKGQMHRRLFMKVGGKLLLDGIQQESEMNKVISETTDERSVANQAQ